MCVPGGCSLAPPDARREVLTILNPCSLAAELGRLAVRIGPAVILSEWRLRRGPSGAGNTTTARDACIIDYLGWRCWNRHMSAACTGPAFSRSDVE